MPETILPAKAEQRIWILSGERFGNPFLLIDILGWVVNGHGRPIPITAQGRVDTDRPYILCDEGGWTVVPHDGTILTCSSDVHRYLEAHARGN